MTGRTNHQGFGPSKLGDERGFTLIEVLIVIVIIGILATIVVIATLSMESSSAATGCRADYKTIVTAQESYKAQVGTYAPSFINLETTTTGIGGDTVGPWIDDAPSSSHYTISIDQASGDVMVAAGGHAAADGNANCAYAS